MIACHKLTQTFGPRRALDGVNLHIAPGEYVTLVGPNGAGKTTLLRILATLSRPTSGAVRVAGLDVDTHGPAIRRQIGYLSHRTLLYDDLTAAQNLAFTARMYDVADAEARIAALLARVDLAARRHDLVRTYSRGMQQRLAVARAVLHRPRLLLLDEPYTGLDPLAADALTALLAELAGEGCTILLTTHHLESAIAARGRVVVLHRGRVVHDAREVGPDFAAQYRALVTALPHPPAPSPNLGEGEPDFPPQVGGLRGVISSQPHPPAPSPNLGEGEPDFPPQVGGLRGVISSQPHPPAPSPNLGERARDFPPQAGGLRGVISKIWAIFAKDMAAEWHTREIFSAMFVYAVLALLIFSFALDLRGAVARAAAPGVLWAAIAFAGTLGLSRSLAREHVTGGMEGLLLAPVERVLIFFGKALGNFALMLAVEAVLLPLAAVLFNVPLLNGGVLLVLLWGTAGYAAVGTLLAAMAVNTRAREVLLPILLLPLAVPLLIGAVQATLGLLDGAPWAEIGNWIQLLVVYTLIITAVSMITFGYVVEE